MSNPTHSMFVRDIMSVNVVTITPGSSVLEVSRLMTKMDLGSIVIVDKERPVGIITESDIVRRVISEERDAKTTLAKDVMSSPLFNVLPNTPLTDAMRIMAKNNIRRVVVLKNDSLAGIITSRDILRWSPELIDILMESLKLKTDQVAAPANQDEDDIMENGGICDGCGEFSNDLVSEDGRYLCEACRG
ncbi:MAG: CBS domain-containing protein [Candidatus Thorarchaeota archaeon]